MLFVFRVRSSFQRLLSFSVSRPGITFCGTWCPLNACVMILTPSSHATCVRDGFNVGIKRVLSVSDSTIWYSILPCSAERLDRGFSEIADWRDW